MAILVQLSVEESSLNSGETIPFTLEVRNTGSEALNITNVSLFPTPATGPGLIGTPSFPPASTTQLPATTGAIRVGFTGTFFANLGNLLGSPTQQQAIGVTAVVTTSDGANTASNTVTVQVVPVIEPGSSEASKVATTGQWDFTSNNNSALWALGFFPL